MDSDPSSSSKDDSSLVPGNCNGIEEPGCSASVVTLNIHSDGLGLQEDLGTMLNDPAYSDMQFVCKDGQKVHACRLLLLARSEVLRQMLTNGMAESRMTEVPLPDITSAALLPTLEFLYTGAIVKYKVTLDIAYQVLHAAQFLLLEKLGKHVLSAIRAAAMEVTDPAVLAQLLSSKLDFEGALDYSDDVARHSVDSLRRCGCSGSYLKHLTSWQALEAYLVLTRTRNEVPVVSFMQYLRLRDVLLWCSRKVSAEAEKAMSLCFPLEESLKRHYETLKTWDKSYAYVDLISADGHPAVYAVIEKVKAFMSTCPIVWSRVVDFRCIHPLILLKIVKPLGIIQPSSLLDEAFAYQALQAGEMNVMKWVASDISRAYYSIGEQGTVVVAKQPRFVDPQCVFVVKANMAINKTYGTYEFDVFVEEGSIDMTIGVASPKIDSIDDDHLLRMVDGRLWYVIRSGASRGEQAWFRCEGQLIKHCRVRIRLDMTNKSCLFSIDGRVVRDVPSKIRSDELYPVVGCVAPGRLRIQLVSDATFM